MADGMHVMIPASEYAEMEAKLERLEKALDKACSKITLLCDDYESYESIMDVDDWKEWCLEND